MTGQQRAVLWIGLILVGLNLVRHWSEIRDVIFSGAGITSGIPGSSSSGGGLQIPGIGGIPGLGGGLKIPGTNLPLPLLSQPVHKTKNVTLV